MSVVACVDAPGRGAACSVVTAAGGGTAAAAALRLDQERDNRFDDWRERVQEGEVVLMPARSGGSFDPLGRRAVDVWRVDDLKAVCLTLGGRWAMLTLTVNRDLFATPEEAYERCNERVRRVMAEVCPRGVYFVAFEVQTKTGDGWPHWHAMAWVPDARSEAELKAAAEKRWTVRAERIDQDTGEVGKSNAVETIGFVDVKDSRDRLAHGTYVAKYLTKRWDAVPTWMGESQKRFRKVRASPGLYAVLERLGRHVRHRGTRRTPRGIGRRTRRLFVRMALSGSTLNVFDKSAQGLSYVRTLRVPISELVAVMDRCDGRPLRLGPYGRCIVAVPREKLRRLVDNRPGMTRWRSMEGDYVAREHARHRSAWDQMQAEREWMERAGT